LLIRKLNTLRIKREIIKKKNAHLAYDIEAPIERVLQILNDLKERLDGEKGWQDNLEYCIHAIQSNKLYELDIEQDSACSDEEADKVNGNVKRYSTIKDAKQWLGEFSSHKKGQKRSAHESSKIALALTKLDSSAPPTPID